jgi:CRISPR/Cas system CSM-associated protein Csm3 (group 7 of RAMP superfamily)
MFGGGEDPQKDGTESDSSPVRAGKVVWNGDTGRFEPDVLVIPGSSMKGPVRHRTRYHLCRRQGVWAEHATPADLRQVDIALSLLFGDVDLENNEGAPDRKSPGDRVRAGCIYLDDLYLDGREGAPPAPDSADIQNHVTIDRVLGGAQDHHLFTDRPLHGGGFTLRIGYEEPHKVRLNQRELELLDLAGDPEDAKARELLGDAKAALASAVEDLKNGLLALGAHGNRGYGWFRVDD